MSESYDVIVIGSGAGGGTLAQAVARAGKRVLLLERGRRFPDVSLPHDERAMLIQKQPYDDRDIDVNGNPTRLYMGGVLGGGTSLYGAALMRPSREDFHPGIHYGDRLEKAIHDWPIDYEDLAPYYERAEQLYHVSGEPSDHYGPLQRPTESYPHSPIPLKPINERLVSGNENAGLKPFVLPLGIDFNICLQCDACPGYICPNGARISAGQVVDAAAQETGSLELKTGIQVERLERSGETVTGVRVTDRESGEQTVLTAKRYVLAAGAIGSPAILLQSGCRHPLIGRNYMMHLSPIVVGLYLKRTGAESTFVKQVGFADHYYGTEDYPHKLGLVQSLPVPGPLMIAKTAPAWLPRAAIDGLRKRMLPLAGIIEDLPNPDNRVTVDEAGRIHLSHRYSEYDFERGQFLTQQMVQILKRGGAAHCLTKSFPSTEHVAHQCGTLRFGTDRDHAVADRNGRLFDHPEVFVADGSLFPTSLGVGPALTIMANALRIADTVIDEL
ncbi:MAG: GMC family oxidoreductase [Planctomycetaceae bacterium]|nr:GMC family oxidoreductase [Planctomycetaceae bacterium]